MVIAAASYCVQKRTNFVWSFFEVTGSTLCLHVFDNVKNIQERERKFIGKLFFSFKVCLEMKKKNKKLGEAMRREWRQKKVKEGNGFSYL
jgi:hypothetical protein